MAGSEYEIELFGKKLIYSEGKLRDIKLHFFMDDLYELIKMQVGQLFDNAGDLNGLLYTTNEDITEIYVTMYDVTIQYIEKNVLKGIEAKEIFLTPGEEPLRKKYKHWNQEIRQRENEAKRKMKEDGLPYEEQMHRFAEYAQREFEDMAVLSEMYLHRLLLPRWQTQFVLVIAVMEYWFSSEITAETK